MLYFVLFMLVVNNFLSMMVIFWLLGVVNEYSCKLCLLLGWVFLWVVFDIGWLMLVYLLLLFLVWV